MLLSFLRFYRFDFIATRHLIDIIKRRKKDENREHLPIRLFQFSVLIERFKKDKITSKCLWGNHYAQIILCAS